MRDDDVAQIPRKLDRHGARYDDDWRGAAAGQQPHATVGQRLALELGERLGPAEPGPLTRGEQHTCDLLPRAHGCVLTARALTARALTAVCYGTGCRSPGRSW